MKNMTSTLWLLLISLAVSAGCGSGGGGNGGGTIDPNAPAVINVTASKPVALANTRDAVTLQATVRKADGSAVADGTAVVFAIDSTGGALSASTASTASGLTTVSLTHSAVVGNNRSVTITARAGAASGTKTVKFIKQPASASVYVSFDNAVANLGTLSFVLTNSTGSVTAAASFDNGAQQISALNAAAGSLAVGNFGSGGNSISLINAGGINTGTSAIIRVIYAISVGLELPVFSIDPFPSNFKATDPNFDPIAPAVTAGNVVVTAVYDTEL